MTHYDKLDMLLAIAQSLVDELLAENDDSRYGLLAAAKDHIIGARADLDADLK